jgi:2-(1,2-epoxy-1,2-dihydrophenyl)acetyl-CoA isomerase
MSGPYPHAAALDVTVHADVLRITMNRPDHRNALDDEAVGAFIATLDRAHQDEAVRAVVLTGAGADFCSGFDIVGRNAGSAERPRVGAIQRRLPSQAHRLIPLLYELQIPVVAAVRGYAVGIGMQLALASDFVVTAEDATFWEPFARRGMTPDSGAAWLLPRVVGPVRARQLLMLGRRLSGAEATEWGIGHLCVPAGEVEARADALAAELAGAATVAIGLTKWLLNTGAEQSLRDHLGNEAFALELASRSPDFREGLRAFAERREPDFGGR